MKTLTCYGHIALCDFDENFFPEYEEAIHLADEDYHKIIRHCATIDIIGEMVIPGVKYGWHTDGDDLNIQITAEDVYMEALHQKLMKDEDGEYHLDDGDVRINKVP